MDFSEELKLEQARLKLTQSELAALLGVSPRAVWQWLQGKEPIPLTKEGALARLKARKTK